jgi:LuxR family transcriptional regulator, quorum-sensing system regulator SdiA
MTHRASIAALLHELDARSPAGLAIALHVRFTRPTYLFQTYAQRWMDVYSAKGFVMHDPVVRWGLQNTGRTRWSDLASIDTAGVLEEAKDHGMMNGVAIGIVLDGSRSIGGFSRADRDYDEAETDELEVLLSRLHTETAGLGQLSAADQRALTELSIKLTH